MRRGGCVDGEGDTGGKKEGLGWGEEAVMECKVDK